MEEKKSKKGLIITLVIVIVLLLTAGGYIVYDYKQDQKTNNKLTDLETKYENTKKDYKQKLKDAGAELESTKSKSGNYIEGKFYSYMANVRIYALGYDSIVYAYKGKMYKSLDITNGTENGTTDESSNMVNILTKKDPSKSSDGLKVMAYDIQEKDINRVIETNNYYTRDAAYFVFFIYKDGTVKRYNHQNKEETILKDYKVENLEVKCGKEGNNTCDSLEYTLTLQDGTTKTVTEK